LKPQTWIATETLAGSGLVETEWSLHFAMTTIEVYTCAVSHSKRNRRGTMNKPVALRLVAVLFALTVAGAAAKAAPCTLLGLQWMAADWHNSANQAGAQERWNVAPSGVLIGSAFESSPDGKGYAEIMTVREDSGSIRMVLRHFDLALSRAWEERTVPMVFIASNCNGTSVVFDGQDDHVGEHLTYKRSGETLLIVGDFLHHGKPDHEEWHMIAAKR
jgi:hypothetical protein